MCSLAVSPPSPFSPAAITEGVALGGLIDSCSPQKRGRAGNGGDDDGSVGEVAALRAEIRRVEAMLNACPWAGAMTAVAGDDVGLGRSDDGSGGGGVVPGSVTSIGVVNRLAAVLRAAEQGQTADQEACRQMRVRGH